MAGTSPSVAQQPAAKSNPRTTSTAPPAQITIPVKEEVIAVVQDSKEEYTPPQQQPSVAKRSIPEVIGQVWDATIAEMQDNQPRLAGILSIATYVVENDALVVKFQSPTQETLFVNEIRKDLSTRLCQALNVTKVTVSTRVEEQKEKSAKPYFPQEKYNYLLGKNPALEKLKDKFNLQIKQ